VEGPAGGPAGQASAARPGGDPAARPGALRFDGAGEEPAATPTPTLGGRARYGEAVVREILGANFIEEQPLPGREG
jgi:DNA polymerase-3 subunit gamma/tau